MKTFSITKVVSRDFIMDFIAVFQNMVGLNLKSHEKMIQKAISQIESEMQEKAIITKWFRYEITQLTNGAVAVMCYGETK